MTTDPQATLSRAAARRLATLCTYRRDGSRCGRPREDETVHVWPDERMRPGAHVWRHRAKWKAAMTDRREPATEAGRAAMLDSALFLTQGGWEKLRRHVFAIEDEAAGLREAPDQRLRALLAEGFASAGPSGSLNLDHRWWRDKARAALATEGEPT